MQVNLADLGNGWHPGSLSGPDGRVYVRRSTRMARKSADQLVDDGMPVVCFHYGAGRFEWHDGNDAREVWRTVRAHVITAAPNSKTLSKHHVWHAGLWVSEDGGQLLYLTGHC